MKCLRLPEQDLCPPRCLDRPECERLGVVRDGGAECVEPERPVSRVGPERAGFARRGPPFLRQTRSRARGPSASGTRASPRGPRLRPRDTSHSATPRCLAARSALGSCPYATSRTSACANASSSSPATDERRCRRRKPFRTSACTTVSESTFALPRAPVQKTFPTTAPAWRYAFSSAGRPSRRALMMPCSVSGSGRSSAEPRSTYSWANCSA